jgi:phosphatidylglycerol---prolipoprotein diacylglyceryl transferase
MYLHNIDPIALHLPFWPHGIHWYGIMYLLGFAIAYFLGICRIRARRLPGVNEEGLSDLLFYGMVGVVLGGRIGYIVFYNFAEFIADPVMLFRINEGGMSFFGGLMGVMATVAWWSWKHKLHVFDTIDFVAPLVPPGLGLGRLGNFINGELWGKFTQADWGVIFPQSLTGNYANLTSAELQTEYANGALSAFARHPTQLYQMFLEGVLLLGFLFWFTRRPQARYAASGWFALLYGIFRFLVEFVRLPDEQLGYLAGGWLTMGQVLSMPLIVLGLVFLFMSRTSPTLPTIPMPKKDIEAKK